LQKFIGKRAQPAMIASINKQPFIDRIILLPSPFFLV